MLGVSRLAVLSDGGQRSWNDGVKEKGINCDTYMRSADQVNALLAPTHRRSSEAAGVSVSDLNSTAAASLDSNVGTCESFGQVNGPGPFISLPD